MEHRGIGTEAVTVTVSIKQNKTVSWERMQKKQREGKKREYKDKEEGRIQGRKPVILPIHPISPPPMRSRTMQTY